MTRSLRTIPRLILSLAAAFVFMPVMAHSQFAVDTSATHAILMDARTGQVLFEKAADDRVAPASLTKLMTTYIIFEKLANGSLKLTDTFPVSEAVWRKWRKLEGSKMFLKEGDRVTVEDLLQGIVVQSGNDACDVVAEGLAGTQENFATWMSQKAKEIGLNSSHFMDASGWPDPDHYMTARDIAHLSRELIVRFPQYYHYFSEKEFTYAGVHQPNRNLLLNEALGVDGLKTGHVEESGYSLSASAKQGDERLIAVVMGTTSSVERAREAEKLLTWGFRNFQTYTLAKPGQQMEKANVWLGEQDTVSLVAAKAVTVLASRDDRLKLKVKVIYKDPIAAPLVKGQPVAILEVTGITKDKIEVQLVAGESVGKIGGFARITAALNQLLWGPPAAVPAAPAK